MPASEPYQPDSSATLIHLTPILPSFTTSAVIHLSPISSANRVETMSELASVKSVSNGTPPPDERDHDLVEFVKPLALVDTTIQTLAYQFAKVYKDLALHSNQQFLPTPVTKLPSGQEVGQFLAIDVGGTNLRVAFIELLGDAVDHSRTVNGAERSRETIRNAQRPRIRRTLEKAWPIGEHLKMDETEDLFAWIGDCIAEVVGDRLSNDIGKGPVPEELDLGITFSFPMMQTKLSAATLMQTGKGFTISSDLDLGSTLLRGYERHTRSASSSDATSPRSKRRRLGPLPRLRISAITNDTIATLSSLAYSVKSLPNSRVVAGLIVGTGVNATIPMKFSDLGVDKVEPIRQMAPTADETVVNTEITIAGACGPLEVVTTAWDRELDAACARPGFQPLEYMTGGRYIGELIRIIFCDYMTNKHNPPIPSASLPATIVHSYSFTTTFVSAVVARARTDSELAGELKRRIPPPESSNWAWTAHSAGALRKIAYMVQVRSAGLIAATTVGLLAAVDEISLHNPAEQDTTSPERTTMSASKESSDNTNHPTKKLSSPSSPKQTLAHRNNNSNKTSTTLFPSPSPSALFPLTPPEELVIAYTGGIIQHYPNFKETCQRFIDRLVMRAGPQEGGKSVLLREARDGGIIGAGVLCAMESIRTGSEELKG